MNKLKYVRIQKEDGSYGDKIPFYVDGTTVEINGQSLTTKINEIDSSLQSKVVKQAGKGLSTNDYTNEEKQKLNGIEAGATHIEIDSTLSVEGAAADAKATGDKINLEKTILQQTINAQAEHFNTEITELQSLVGSPLVATTAAEMTDIDKIYVYVGSETGYINGNWYYYNGTSWVSGGIYNAVALATDPTLTQSGQAADAKVVGDEINELKEDLNDVSHSVKTLDAELIKGKVKKMVTGKIVILDGKDPVALNTDFTAQKVTIHGRNRFNLTNAGFSYNNYSAQHTLIKENNGITVQCNVSQTDAYLYTYTEYIAEFDGDLYFSCEAETSGNISDICALVVLNGTSQTRLYGQGLLYEKVTVSKNDTVRLLFYTHMGTNAYNTVQYKNIMLAYGGLYDYAPYTSDVQNTTTETVTYNLPTASNMYDLGTTSTNAYKWLKISATNANLPSNLRPVNNNTVASGITVAGLPLVTYNQTYNETVGLGLASSGNIGIYNNQNRTDFLAWLAENPVSISYEAEGSDYTDISHDFICGEIIEFGTESQEVTYYHKAHEAKGKVICFGDSITGMFGNSCDYPTMLTLLHDIQAINAGFAGCRWTDHADSKYRPFSMNRLVEAIVSNDFTLQDASALVDDTSASYKPLFAEHLANIKSVTWADIEFVTMFWGTNDWGDGATLKSSDDTHATNKQRTNVEDAIKYSISQLVGKYPWLKVIVITPYWRSITTGKDSNVDANSNDEYLYTWAEYMGNVAQDNYNVPVIALYRTLGANVITNRYYTQDGTHPTEMTKRIIATRIAKEIAVC